MKPFYKLLDVRPDVRDGTLDQSVYAASLGDVASKIDKPTAKNYRNYDSFMSMTYETEGVHKALDEIRIRLREGKGNGVRQIETSFGGGKTHAMIFMYHKCRDWGAKPIVIDGQFLDTKSTPWGEIEKQLDGNIHKMVGQVAPSGEEIYELLQNRDKPILILIDEIFNYMVSASAIRIGNSDLAAQTIVFMQRLCGQIGSLPNICLVMSLSNKDDVLDIDTGNITAKKQNEYYTNLQNIVGRHHQMITVSENKDVSHIIRRRLFETEESLISDHAKDTIQYCIEQMKEGGSISADNIDEYATRFTNSYPFTPDVIDVLDEKWGAYPKFQRTRGVLRLLSLVVHSMLKSKRGWISLGDIDLSIPEIRKELLKHTGDNAESAITADIIGSNALAKKCGEEGVRCVTSVFMYSFPSTVRGATLDEVKRSSFTDKIAHWVAGDVVNRLVDHHCFYLERTQDKMFRFDVKPNLNKMIDQAKENVSSTDVEETERDILDGAMDGGQFADIHIWPDETHAFNIPDRPVLQLIICKKNNPEWCRNVLNGIGKSSRINMNGLIFVLPSDGFRLGDLIRKQLGLKDVEQRLSGSPEFTKEKQDRITSDLKGVKDGIGDALHTKYSVVYIPGKDRSVVKVNDYLFNPAEDSRKSLDGLMWERLTDEGHIAFRIAPDIAQQYGMDADSAYETLIRVSGNVMPANFEVVRTAFEPREPEVEEGGEPDTPTWGGTTWGDEPEPEPTEPEVMCEGVLYNDVVDAVGLNNIRGLLLVPNKYTLTTFVCNTNLRPDGMYDIHLEIRGKIPHSTANGINKTKRGEVTIYDEWGE